MSWAFKRNWKVQGENESIEINPRRKRWSPNRSLNYRDLMIVKSVFFPDLSFTFIPTSDARRESRRATHSKQPCHECANRSTKMPIHEVHPGNSCNIPRQFKESRSGSAEAFCPASQASLAFVSARRIRPVLSLAQSEVSDLPQSG